jgi:probable HAF family extracellular repeat protein
MVIARESTYSTPRLYSLNPANGSIYWQVPVDTTDTDQWFLAPTLGPDGATYAASGTQVKKVSATGSVLWTYTFSGTLNARTPVAVGANGHLYVGAKANGEDKILAINESTGALVWEWEIKHTPPGGSQIGLRIHTALSIAGNGDILFGTAEDPVYYGRIFALKPDASVASHADRIRWWGLVDGTATTTPVIGLGNEVYMASIGVVGIPIHPALYKFTPGSGGSQVSGTKLLSTGGKKIHSTPAIDVNGMIFFGTEENKVYAVNPNGSAGWISPDLSPGIPLALKNSSPVISDQGDIYITSGDGKLYAFKHTTPARLADTPWPMYLNNKRHSAYAGLDGTIQDLGQIFNPGGPTPTEINDKGVIVGHQYDSYNGYDRAFMWANGTINNLGAPSGYLSSWAYGINDQATNVGAAKISSSGGTYPYKHEYGAYTILGTLGGTYSSQQHSANSVNNGGHIVGSSLNSSGNARAVLWNPGNNSAVDLRTLAGISSSYSSAANRINNSGWIVGLSHSADSGNPQHAFLVHRTATLDFQKDLGTLTGLNSDISTAAAVNEFGYVAGTSYDSSFWGRAFIKAPDGGSGFTHTKHANFTNLGVLSGGLYSVASDINDLNMVVGNSGNWSTSNGFIYVPRLGYLVNLNSVIPASAGWVISSAVAINNQMKVTGTGVINGQTRAFVLNLE